MAPKTKKNVFLKRSRLSPHPLVPAVVKAAIEQTKEKFPHEVFLQHFEPKYCWDFGLCPEPRPRDILSKYANGMRSGPPGVDAIVKKLKPAVVLNLRHTSIARVTLQMPSATYHRVLDHLLHAVAVKLCSSPKNTSSTAASMMQISDEEFDEDYDDDEAGEDSEDDEEKNTMMDIDDSDDDAMKTRNSMNTKLEARKRSVEREVLPRKRQKTEGLNITGHDFTGHDSSSE